MATDALITVPKSKCWGGLVDRVPTVTGQHTREQQLAEEKVNT